MKTAILALLFASASAFAQPNFPTNIVVTPQTNGSVNVTWTPGSSTNVNSVVYIGVASNTYNVSLTVSNGNVANIPNLAPGFTYFFRVRAKDRVSGVESDPSNEASYSVTKPSSHSGLQTTQITPVLEYAPFPEGPWTTGDRWETRTFISDADRRFFRVRLDYSSGPLITKL